MAQEHGSTHIGFLGNVDGRHFKRDRVQAWATAQVLCDLQNHFLSLAGRACSVSFAQEELDLVALSAVVLVETLYRNQEQPIKTCAMGNGRLLTDQSHRGCACRAPGP